MHSPWPSLALRLDRPTWPTDDLDRRCHFGWKNMGGFYHHCTYTCTHVKCWYDTNNYYILYLSISREYIYIYTYSMCVCDYLTHFPACISGVLGLLGATLNVGCQRCWLKVSAFMVWWFHKDFCLFSFGSVALCHIQVQSITKSSIPSHCRDNFSGFPKQLECLQVLSALISILSPTQSVWCTDSFQGKLSPVELESQMVAMEAAVRQVLGSVQANQWVHHFYWLRRLLSQWSMAFVSRAWVDHNMSSCFTSVISVFFWIQKIDKVGTPQDILCPSRRLPCRRRRLRRHWRRLVLAYTV